MITKENLELTTLFVGKQGKRRERDFDDFNDNRASSRAGKPGRDTRAENLDSGERYSAALDGYRRLVFDNRRRIVVDNLDCNGLTTASLSLMRDHLNRISAAGEQGDELTDPLRRFSRRFSHTIIIPAGISSGATPSIQRSA
jgi:hypothetical protein